MSKEISVEIKTAESDLTFTTNPNALGKQLFNQITGTLNIREVWYFGLKFQDKYGKESWLKMDKKIASHEFAKSAPGEPLRLEFLAKFYPEDLAEEIIEMVTLKFFYLQIRADVLSSRIYASPEVCVLLASYACQAKHGEYDADKVDMAHENLLPRSVLDQHDIPLQEWIDKILVFYRRHACMLKEDAMLEYVRAAQDLEQFGITFFEITNKSNTELLLGVDALGLNVYSRTDKLTPKVGFPWGEIRKISYNGKKFVIRSTDKTAPNFVFFSPSARDNKRVISLCMGNHVLFVRRRKDDSIEMQQMRANAKEQKDARLSDLNKLMAERRAREDAVKRMEELEMNLRTTEQRKVEAEELAAEYQEKLAHMQAQIDELNEQRAQMVRMKRELEQNYAQLESARNNTDENMHELEERNEAIRMEIESMQKEMKEKSEMLEKHQNELHQLEEETQMKQQRILELEMEKVARDEAEATAAATQMSNGGGGDGLDDNDGEVDLELLDGPQGDLTRQAMLNTNVDLKQALSMLSSDLEKRRTETKPEDLLHAENQKKGRDKFQTLRDIRQGNTKKRVDQFEML